MSSTCNPVPRWIPRKPPLEFDPMTISFSERIIRPACSRFDIAGRLWPACRPGRPAHVRRLALGLGVAWMLASCASGPASPEAIVRDRAQARLDAIIAGQWEKAYGYLSPASRAVVSLEAWRSGLPRATVWRRAQVHAVACEVLDRCKTTVVIHHQPLVMGGRMGTIDSAVDEIWVLDEGRWWLLLSR